MRLCSPILVAFPFASHPSESRAFIRSRMFNFRLGFELRAIEGGTCLKCCLVCCRNLGPSRFTGPSLGRIPSQAFIGFRSPWPVGV